MARCRFWSVTNGLRPHDVAEEATNSAGTDYQLRQPARTLGQHGDQRCDHRQGKPGNGGQRVEAQLGPAVRRLVQPQSHECGQHDDPGQHGQGTSGDPIREASLPYQAIDHGR
jgi:hypothetical protein